jgi:hypothetical protein
MKILKQYAERQARTVPSIAGFSDRPQEYDVRPQSSISFPLASLSPPFYWSASACRLIDTGGKGLVLAGFFSYRTARSSSRLLINGSARLARSRSKLARCLLNSSSSMDHQIIPIIRWSLFKVSLIGVWSSVQNQRSSRAALNGDGRMLIDAHQWSGGLGIYSIIYVMRTIPMA